MTHLAEDDSQDAAASVDTAYTMSVGETDLRACLADKSDEDWIRVELVAGESYDIRLRGIGPEPVFDTVLKVFNSDGKEVACNDDIDTAAVQVNSMVEFSPDTTGDYYISASVYPNWFDDSGTYEVTVFDEKDNHAETPYGMAVGDRFEGTLDDKFDEDWIRVDLVEGKTYTITLNGIGPDVDTDTVLRIYNSEGEQVGFHDDEDYAAGKVNSVLTFSPDAGGVYFLSAGADRGNPARDNSGRYQVTVYEVGADYALTLTGAEDDFYYHTRLTGSIGDDTLDGRGGWDWLEGGAGADILIGGTGKDTASYQYSDAGVQVRLDDGTAWGGHAEGDTFAGRQTVEYVQRGDKALSSEVPELEEFIISLVFGEDDEEVEEIEILDIEDLFGSAHDDILVGTYGTNWLFGYYGNDVLDGKEGNDFLLGGDGSDALIGGEGNDGLFGGDGSDALIGGEGIDYALYIYSDEGVEVDLHNGVGRGGYAEGDTFPGRQAIEYTDPSGETREIEVPDVENLYGSEHDDILVGSQGSNRLIGYKGDDELDGREGHDLLEGFEGADVLRGGAGNDLASYAYSDEAVEVRLHNGTARGGDAEGDTFPGMKTVEYVNHRG